MTEIEKLIHLLDISGVPYEIRQHWNNSKMVCYPCYGQGRVCDAVCFPGSYGYANGLLEIMGLVKDDEIDDVEGWLTANEVFCRILRHYLDNAAEN